MLTPARQAMILAHLEQYETATVTDFVQLTKASKATIRRDLSFLEKTNKLKRCHGGAMKVEGSIKELTYLEKKKVKSAEKKCIARFAAHKIKDHDVIFLDAGTSTYEMIPFLRGRQVTVVTIGLTHLALLQKYNITTHIIGGKIKNTTSAVIGSLALKHLEHYYFNRTFVGTNGIDVAFGYSTPDEEEAAIKEKAVSLCDNNYILSDDSKIGVKSTYCFAKLKDATIITNKNENVYKDQIKKVTHLEEVHCDLHMHT